MKPENRNPKAERSPKPENRKGPNRTTRWLAGKVLHSVFGIRISFGLRASEFGFVLSPEIGAAFSPHTRREFPVLRANTFGARNSAGPQRVTAGAAPRAVSQQHTTKERRKRMKIKDVPQVGKLGLTVTWPGRNGLIRRILVTPRNPRTTAQLIIRQNLATQASAYDQLTDAEQEAWVATAAQIQSKPTLGQSGPLTGLQLFTKVNCARLAIGGTPVSAPPARPEFSPLPIDGLEVTNVAGAIAIRLHTTDAPPDGTMLRACPPQKSGCRRGISYRLLGTLDSPVSSYITITSAYTSRFGVPAIGNRVFVSVNANVNGYEGVPLTFSARVPAAS
jgi:hypothetical protein